MPSYFLDRTAELRALERMWSARDGQLALVWGRRRTGKSYLLAHFAEGRRSVFYTATEQSPEVELTAFSERVRAVLDPGPRDVLAGGPFRTWDEALHYLAAAAQAQPLLVVLDEFSYLMESNPSLPSIVQRFWDRSGRASRLRLVLCGSATGVLEGLGAAHAPLFGRFTTRLQVHPFSFRDAAGFHPGLAPADQALVYGVLGGMPLYLRLWDADEPVEANLVRLFGDASAPLLNEGELLLRTELPEAAGYFRLMAAIAEGHAKFSGIRDVARMDPTRGLERLASVRLVERRAPVTEELGATRRRTHRIGDNFLAFWFRFVYPHRGEIERGLGPQVVRTLVLPRLDGHMGPVFEELARDHVRNLAVAGRLDGVTRVGSWWSADGRTGIGVVALGDRRVTLAGEASWDRPLDRGALVRLRQALRLLPGGDGGEVPLALFARLGIDGVRRQEARLVTVEDLYR
ncbi:MAG TPA: ATP-binding protein [Actinomycetes bacterium]|nr:ATP-binding protein [Actinomycetes bacterium]